MIGKYLFLFLIIFSINPSFEAQKKEAELTPYQERLIQLKDFRKNCRIALRPFRYDGSLTTHFTYKEFDYAKEVEIATIQNENYQNMDMFFLHDFRKKSLEKLNHIHVVVIFYH